MLTSVILVFYNMADKMVAGRFSDDPFALGAIGSTSSLTTLFVNFIVETIIGIGTAVSYAYGAEDLEKVKKTVHISFFFPIMPGILSGYPFFDRHCKLSSEPFIFNLLQYVGRGHFDCYGGCTIAFGNSGSI